MSQRNSLTGKSDSGVVGFAHPGTSSTTCSHLADRHIAVCTRGHVSPSELNTSAQVYDVSLTCSVHSSTSTSSAFRL